MRWETNGLRTSKRNKESAKREPARERQAGYYGRTPLPRVQKDSSSHPGSSPQTRSIYITPAGRLPSYSIPLPISHFHLHQLQETTINTRPSKYVSKGSTLRRPTTASGNSRRTSWLPKVSDDEEGDTRDLGQAPSRGAVEIGGAAGAGVHTYIQGSLPALSLCGPTTKRKERLCAVTARPRFSLFPVKG